MSPALLFSIAFACFLISAYLAIFAYYWRRKQANERWGAKPVAPVINCENCRQGLAELSHTSVTGCWTCHVCGDAWTLVDGKPGTLEAYSND